MTTEELRAVFIADHVPTNYYSLDGKGGGDNYVLQQENGTWKTFYSERGSADDVRTYANEDEACRGMFALLARMMRSSQHRDIMLNACMNQQRVKSAATTLDSLLRRYAPTDKEAAILQHTIGDILSQALNSQLQAPLAFRDVPGEAPMMFAPTPTRMRLAEACLRLWRE